MSTDALDRQIERARRRLKELAEQDGGSGKPRAAPLEALEELSTALEELHVAAEELRQQNDELAAARQGLEAERQRYQELFEFAPDGYLVTDPEGIVREANAAAATLLGVSANFLVGKPLSVFVPGEDQAALYERLGRLQGSTQILEDWQIGLQPRERTSFPASLTVGAVRDPAGRLIGLRWLLRDITERKRAEEDLCRSREELRALAAHLEVVREDERAASAKAVHDELGQGLAGVKFKLASLAAWPPAEAGAWQAEVREVLTLLDAMLQGAVRISEGLHSSLLDFFGLAAVIQAEAKVFQARTGIVCDVTADVGALPVDRAQVTGLFRICQESLDNVAAHAQATRVIIRLFADADRLGLTMEDNGRGIAEQEAASPTSLGLVRLREQALSLGGSLSILGQPNKGTAVTVRVPLHTD